MRVGRGNLACAALECSLCRYAEVGERARTDGGEERGAVRRTLLAIYRRHGESEHFRLHAPQERHAFRGDLDRAISTLRPKCQSLLRMRYGFGYSTEETAQQLGYTLSSLDNIARRCLAALSQRLLSCTLAIRSRC